VTIDEAEAVAVGSILVTGETGAVACFGERYAFFFAGRIIAQHKLSSPSTRDWIIDDRGGW
jgi:hypothetical protein